jgi:hypothetical protein
VSTHILDLKTGQRKLANEFHFTFISRDPDATPRLPVKVESLSCVLACTHTHTLSASDTCVQPCAVRPIEPKTYVDGMRWLDGRRRMLEALDIAKRGKGFAGQALF